VDLCIQLQTKRLYQRIVVTLTETHTQIVQYKSQAEVDYINRKNRQAGIQLNSIHKQKATNKSISTKKKYLFLE